MSYCQYFSSEVIVKLTVKESRLFVMPVEWKMEREEKREWDKGWGGSCDLKRRRGCLQPLLPFSCFPFLFCSIQPLFIPLHFPSHSSVIIFTFL